MRVIAIVQARVGSSRLPGKVLEPLSGELVIARVFRQLSYTKTVDEAILATSDRVEDDPLVNQVETLGVRYFRGSLHNVLERYCQAGTRLFSLSAGDAIVRITADCPLIEPSIVDKVVLAYKEFSVDYCTNTLQRTYPDGYDVEIIRFGSLLDAFARTTSLSDLEHVTPYIRRESTRYRQQSVEHDTDLSRLRLTLDTLDDLQTLELLLNQIPRDRPFIAMSDVLKAIDQDAGLRARVTCKS